MSDLDTDSSVVSTNEVSTDHTGSENDSDEEYSFEYDDQDEKYEELIDKHMLKDSEESNMEYYHHLELSKKDELFKLTKEIYSKYI